MQLNKEAAQKSAVEKEEVYAFRKEQGKWYIDLPAYLEQGWSKSDLQMVEGAHKFLNTLSNGANELRLMLSREKRDKWDVLELIELCEAPKGGAIYLFTQRNHQPHSAMFWICDLALFVFGDTPDRIYVQRLPVKEKRFSFKIEKP